MNDDLHRLVYYSVNRIRGSSEEIAGSIAEILASSQANNARVGLTGALIFNAGIFAQVLEGRLGEIEKTFERIQRDVRHGDVQVLAFEQVAARGFPSWSMGFVGQSRHAEDILGQIGRDTGFEAKRLEGERIFQIMHDIAIDEESRAA
jgi:hypothetical protein